MEFLKKIQLISPTSLKGKEKKKENKVGEKKSQYVANRNLMEKR